MVILCAGIDLAAREHRPSGISIVSINENKGLSLVLVSKAYRDEDLLKLLLNYSVKAVAIDSPLSLPLSGYYRNLDLKLKKMGFKVLPPAWKSMKELTLRAVRLANTIRSLGIEVLETHPLSCIKSSGCDSFKLLVNKLGLMVPEFLSKDEKDSIVAALACVFYQIGECLVISASDGFIILLPKIC